MIAPAFPGLHLESPGNAGELLPNLADIFHEPGSVLRPVLGSGLILCEFIRAEHLLFIDGTNNSGTEGGNAEVRRSIMEFEPLDF